MQERLEGAVSRAAERVEGHSEETEGILPIMVVVLALAAVVVLFLLFKFNLFNGGQGPDVRTTMPSGVPALIPRLGSLALPCACRR